MNAALLLINSHSTTARGHLRKLAEQFRMDKRNYCPSVAVSFVNVTWQEDQEAGCIGRLEKKMG